MRPKEKAVNIDATVQEKNTTYPTDVKPAIKIIIRLNKLAKAYGVRLRRTFGKEAKGLGRQVVLPGPDPRHSCFLFA